MGIVTKLGNYRKKFSSKVENRELLIDSITAFFIRILAAIASFLMNMVVARKLGAYNSGSFFLCFAVITVIAVVVRLVSVVVCCLSFVVCRLSSVYLLLSPKTKG